MPERGGTTWLVSFPGRLVRPQAPKARSCAGRIVFYPRGSAPGGKYTDGKGFLGPYQNLVHIAHCTLYGMNQQRHVVVREAPYILRGGLHVLDYGRQFLRG